MPNQVESLDEGKKLKVTLETGEIFEGDPLEVTNKMAAAHVETKRWGQAAHAEVKTLKEKPVTPPVVPPPNAEEAQLDSYLLERHAKALGFKNAEEYKAELADVRSVKERQKNQAVAADFMQQCQDFPNTDAAIEALKGKMEKMGYDYTPQSMIAAHMLCLRENAYKPLTNDEWSEKMAAAGRGGSAAPMIRSNSPETVTPVDLWSEDPQKQRERIIREQLAEQGR